MKGMVVDRVVAGKMVDSRILMDGLGMMTQLGVIPRFPRRRRSPKEKRGRARVLDGCPSQSLPPGANRTAVRLPGGIRKHQDFDSGAFGVCQKP